MVLETHNLAPARLPPQRDPTSSRQGHVLLGPSGNLGDWKDHPLSTYRVPGLLQLRPMGQASEVISDLVFLLSVLCRTEVK